MKEMIKAYHWIVQPVLVVLILVVGFVGAMSFSLFNEEPAQSERADYVPIVRVIETGVSTEQVVIEGNGTIEARTRINIVPQVGGKVVYIHPDLRAGGVFAENELLLEIERIDYELAVTQQEAEVARAQTALELELADAETSREEWLDINPNEEIPTLVGREPQIAEAKAALASARAQLARARLDLQRTQVSIPFTGRVVNAMIDKGEVISANQQVGVVYSTERFEIPVSLDLEELAWIDISNDAEESTGNLAKITVKIGETEHQMSGYVTRIESELEEISRFARVIVTLDYADIPEQLKSKVIPGLFVDVSIISHEFAEVTTLPRASLREGNVLWTIEEGQLRYTIPDIVYKSDNEIVVRELAQGTQVITSDLTVVTEGMNVRVASGS
ncbi:MAG: efflux RND transporter periplasmic adaptor subunit [Pseudomonadota bacterium]